MKYLWLIVFSMCAMTLSADEATMPSSPTALTAITQDMLEDFFMGNWEDIPLICPAGLELPLTLAIHGELMELVEHQPVSLSIKFLKTTYVKCLDSNYLFSLDGENWLEAVQFFTGGLCAAIKIQEGIPVSQIDFELNLRK